MKRRDRFVVYRQQVTVEDQRQIVNEVIQSHNEFSRGNNYHQKEWTLLLGSSKTSIKLEMGVGCGDDLSQVLTKAACVAREAFRRAASEDFPDDKPLLTLSDTRTALSGVVLAYGLNGSMPPHYDSPTQPGQREEWLAMITVGQSVDFPCNNDNLKLESGDVLVMDSMAILHGVDGILSDARYNLNDVGLPCQCRVGVLFWQGRIKDTRDSSLLDETIPLEGSLNLFETGD